MSARSSTSAYCRQTANHSSLCAVLLADAVVAQRAGGVADPDRDVPRLVPAHVVVDVGQPITLEVALQQQELVRREALQHRVGERLAQVGQAARLLVQG